MEAEWDIKVSAVEWCHQTTLFLGPQEEHNVEKGKQKDTVFFNPNKKVLCFNRVSSCFIILVITY